MSIRKDAYWTAADTVITSGLAFALRLIVARMLAPEDFGLAMIAVTIVGLLQTVNDFGLTSTLIQRDEKDVTRDLIDTTFTASLAVTVLLVLLTGGVVAPLAATQYGEPQLLPLILALSLTLLPSPVTTVASALMFREGRFRANALIKVASNVIGMVAAIIMLLIDPTPWVIVVQVLTTAAAGNIMVHIARPYRYRLRLVREHLSPIFGFSTFILLGSLLSNAQANAGVFVLGLVLPTASVGYYALAAYLTDTARRIVMSILNRVTFVHFSRAKHDGDFLRDKFVSAVKWNCRALFPLMTALMLFGPDWAPQFMGPRWTSLGPLLFWLSATVIVGTAGGSTSNLFKSMGRPGLDLTIMVATTGGLLLPAMYFSGARYGLEGAVVATFAVKVVAVTIRMVALRRLVPGAAVGALRVSLYQALLQLPIVAAWGAVALLKIENWYWQLPLVALAMVIYAVYEFPTAFPEYWMPLKQKATALVARQRS